jgi:hypothetical protein
MSTLETTGQSSLDDKNEELILDQAEKFYNMVSEKLTEKTIENLIEAARTSRS